MKPPFPPQQKRPNAASNSGARFTRQKRGKRRQYNQRNLRAGLLRRLIPPFLWPPLILIAIYAVSQHYLPDGLFSELSNSSISSPARTSSGKPAGRLPDSNVLSGNRPISLDGDTIELNGQRIRLKGMDTPEMRQSCQMNNRSYRCGVTARDQLIKLIGKQMVTCQSQGRDQYNRILGLCRAGNIDLNRTLVEQGWAVSFGLYQREEAQARRDKRGLWAGQFERPSKWRKSNSYRSNSNG